MDYHQRKVFDQCSIVDGNGRNVIDRSRFCGDLNPAEFCSDTFCFVSADSVTFGAEIRLTRLRLVFVNFSMRRATLAMVRGSGDSGLNVVDRFP
jgi:hypothetical protein